MVLCQCEGVGTICVAVDFPALKNKCPCDIPDSPVFFLAYAVKSCIQLSHVFMPKGTRVARNSVPRTRIVIHMSDEDM